jgi:hypothetical protein
MYLSIWQINLFDKSTKVGWKILEFCNLEQFFIFEKIIQHITLPLLVCEHRLSPSDHSPIFALLKAV